MWRQPCCPVRPLNVRLHYASCNGIVTLMPVQITIRGVSDSVRNELAARAARNGQSMQEFLRAELERIASLPSPEEWLVRVRARKEASDARVSVSGILRARDADRR